MSIVFYCESCSEKIVVNFLDPGDLAVCNKCDHKNVVPEKSVDPSETPRKSLRSEGLGCDRVSIATVAVQNYHNSLLYALKRIAIGVILIIINFDLSLGSIVFQLSAIGHIFILQGLLKMKNFNKFRGLINSIFVLSIIHVISGTLALVGLGHFFSFNLNVLVILLICYLYYMIVNRVEKLIEFRKPIFIVLIIQVITAIAFILFILSIPLLIKVTEYLASLPMFNSFTALFGLMLPIITLTLISGVLMLYISFSLNNFLKKQNPDSIVFNDE